MKRHKSMKRKGRRTLDWERCRRKLKAEFEAAGTTTCEMKLDGCWYTDGLTFAHRVKRRFITTESELRTVCLACMRCHQKIEALSHVEMREKVEDAITKAGRTFSCFINSAPDRGKEEQL